MKAKTIWHVASYDRNYGDFVLIASIRKALVEISDIPLRFVSVDCQKTHFYDEIVDKLNEEADMILIGGGGFIFNRPEDNSISGWQWSIGIESIRRIKVPIVVYGIGYNRFFFDTTSFKEGINDHLKCVLAASELFSVRNHGTLRELVDRGLSAEKIKVIPDAGMFLEGRRIDIPQLNNDRMKIGVNFVSDRPQYTYPNRYTEVQDYIYNNLIEVLKYYVENFNALIINIEHIMYLDEDVNLKFKNALGKENYFCLCSDGRKIYPPSLTYVEYLIGVYDRMDFVVGMRGHSNIISFGRHIPFISLSSHNKNRFFLEEIDENYIIDIRNYEDECNAENMLKKIELVRQDYTYKERMQTKKYEMREQFDDFNKKVIEVLIK